MGDMFVLRTAQTIIVYAILIAFVITTLLGPLVIPVLRRLKFGQNIRDEGPQSHKQKAGTPTMGGFIFIIGAAIAVPIMIRGSLTNEAMIALYALIAFGFIGFLDDMLKIIHKNNLGLRAYQKMILLVVIAFAFSYYGYKYVGTDIIWPFLRVNMNLGIFYIPCMMFFFAAITNGVNLTDGLDGLATTVSLLVFIFFTLISLGSGHYKLAIYSAVMAGALLGFLRSNAFPAKVFMGDTGSLALGGAIGAIAMMLKAPLIIVIVGGIYLLETLSVIIQVLSVKLTGKRVFKMAPLHHHFEMIGWPETKVVVVFAILTSVLCLVGFVA